MEIIKRVKCTAIWQDKDAEGRKVYLIGYERDGIEVQPTGNCPLYSLAEASRQIEAETGQ